MPRPRFGRPLALFLSSILITGALAALAADNAHEPGGHGPAERARVLSTQALPRMNGEHLTTTLVEVTYGPGEGSSPHSHPCAVTVYVVSGAVRTQIDDQPEAVYAAGQSFHEDPGAVHRVSANASATESATFIALLTCDHPGELSTPVAEPKPVGGR